MLHFESHGRCIHTLVGLRGYRGKHAVPDLAHLLTRFCYSMVITCTNSVYFSSRHTSQMRLTGRFKCRDRRCPAQADHTLTSVAQLVTQRRPILTPPRNSRINMHSPGIRINYPNCRGRAGEAKSIQFQPFPISIQSILHILFFIHQL